MLAVIAVVVWAMAGVAAAQQVPGPFGPAGSAPVQSDPGLECITTGYDIVLVNRGTEPLAAGTVLAWSVAFARLKGEYILDRDVEPGRTVHVTGALLTTYLSKPKPCVLTRAAVAVQ